MSEGYSGAMTPTMVLTVTIKQVDGVKNPVLELPSLIARRC